jgi:GT2 family glycosyltransferase
MIMPVIHFPAKAINRAQEYIDSALVSQEMIRKIVGTKIRYGIEFIDLYSLLSAREKNVLFPLFDEGFYRSQRHDLAAQESAIVDYLINGVDSGIAPHPLIDLEYMRFLRPDLDRPNKLEFSTFLALIRDNIVDPSPYFEKNQYCKVVKGTPVSRSFLIDFLLRGVEPGASPHSLIDIEYYRSSYNDVPSDSVAAFLHFVTTGDAERRSVGSRFEPVWYSEHYAEGGLPLDRPLHHYLRYGRFASRSPNAAKAGTTAAATLGNVVVQAPQFDRSSPTVLHNYGQLTTRIAEPRQMRIERFVEADVRPIALEDPESAVAQLAFTEHVAPQIDILIPCYQEFDKTIECLASISSAPPVVPVRVTVIDDCSPDPRFMMLGDVPGLTYLRNERNLHFLRSCNGAYRQGAAPYVLLLNNDAQLVPGAIDKLWETLDSHDDIVAASPMILYPNGRLQEAGCVVEANGDTGMVGVGDDPALPQYTRDRDIAYGSGACLLARRESIGETLFDERFAPAYCEDVDLCIRLRLNGGRIRYVADARCVHHLSATTSSMPNRRRVQLVRRNQQRLLEKWGPELKKDLAVQVLAFYLPQFHPVPQNDLWWGKGFTEWTNVTRAQPSYQGHYQPHLPSDLGYYDLRLIETMEEQMRLARRYGVQGFVMYYYNFKGERVLDLPLRNLIAHGSSDFRFCLCWANENWTKHWDGGSQSNALMTQDYEQPTFEAFADDAIAAARLPGAITVKGLPLLLIYRPMLIPEVAEVCAYLRRRFVAAGFDGVYLAYVESMETANQGIEPETLGFNASVEFPPQGIAEPIKKPPQAVKPGFLGKIYDYSETVVNACNSRMSQNVRFPAVFPSWDNTPRQPLAHTTLEGALPEKFQAYVEAKLTEVHHFLSGDERLLFVNAWNEWAEGAHLEPDQMFEHDWLRAISDTLKDRQFF